MWHLAASRLRRTVVATALPTLILEAACRDGGTGSTELDGISAVPCGEAIAQVPGARISFTGLVLTGHSPRLEWTGDGSTLLVLALSRQDPCFAATPATIPTVFAVSAETGAARAVLPVMGATSDATVGADGRSALYFTPVRRDAAGQDVHGLVRVRIDGAADTLLRATRLPPFSAVDAGGRVVAVVAAGTRRSVREGPPDTLVAVDLATGARRVVRVLDDVGDRVLSLSPDASRVLLDSRSDDSVLLVHMADGALLGRFRIADAPQTSAGRSRFVAAARWRADGGADLLLRSDSGSVDGPSWRLFETLRVPGLARARIGRVRGVTVPYDWLPDGSVAAWEMARPDSAVAPLVSGGRPPVAATLRLLAPGAAPRDLVRGRFRTTPEAVRGSPDGRRVAFATLDVVGVVPVR